MSSQSRNGNWTRCPSKVPFNPQYHEKGRGQAQAPVAPVAPGNERRNGNGSVPVTPVAPGSNGQIAMNGNGRNNGQMPVNQFTPTNSYTSNEPIQVVTPTTTNGNGNGNGKRPVVSGVTTNGSSLPGKAQIGSSRPQTAGRVSSQNNGYQSQSEADPWSQWGGQVSQAPVVNPGTGQGSGGSAADQGNLWPQFADVRTSTGRIDTAASQQAGMQQVYRVPTMSGPAASDQLNLNESAQTYLQADAEGHIFAVRDNTHYQLSADDQGRVGIQPDGKCNVWAKVSSSPEDQIHFFDGRGGEDDAIIVNNQRVCGPVIARMMRGSDGNDADNIIQGMNQQTSSSAQTTPDWHQQMNNSSTRATTPNWYQQMINPTQAGPVAEASGTDWYASQW